MDNTVVNRSPGKNSINIDRSIIIDRNIDSDSNVISNIERDLDISNQPWYIRLLGISSLILFIIFMSVGITTFVMALTKNISNIQTMIISTSVFLVFGCINGLLAIILISRRENKDSNI